MHIEMKKLHGYLFSKCGDRLKMQKVHTYIQEMKKLCQLFYLLESIIL